VNGSKNKSQHGRGVVAPYLSPPLEKVNLYTCDLQRCFSVDTEMTRKWKKLFVNGSKNKSQHGRGVVAPSLSAPRVKVNLYMCDLQRCFSVDTEMTRK